MRRELRYAASGLRRRPLLALIAWSVPEALPSALLGLAVARAVDDGFLAGRPAVGMAWLGVLLVSGLAGAIGARQVFRALSDLVEPVRDDLVRRVVKGAMRAGAAGRADDGAVSRLTRQVEAVRDTYAGLIVVCRSFLITVIGAVAGLLSIAPLIALLILPFFLLGCVAFVATLGLAADRYRAAVRADEQLATTTGSVLAATRDIAARGAEDHAAAMASGPIADQAAAERGLAWVSALRTLCFVVGGWVPLVVILAAGPWLVGKGVTAGAVLGGLTYVLFGLQPALGRLFTGLGASGLRFVVTLKRVLDAADQPPPPHREAAPRGHGVSLRGVTFAYGPHAEPVLRALDLDLPEGDHLAVVGPSGIGKSTLAGLVCGLLRPGAGTVLVGGCSAAEVAEAARVLIPQEAYAFAGTVRDNLAYLHPDASDADIATAVAAVGAAPLVARLGGLDADLRPAELSAGERQLVALARAYLAPAAIAVLDEATCHLDPAAERVAEEAFAARPGTLVVIAHRISSAFRARRVLVLDGTSAAFGDHETLLATSPLYRDLVGHWTATGPPGDQSSAQVVLAT